MTFQNKFNTIYFIMLESFDFFSNNFLIFAPVAPLKWLNQTPIGASDNIFYRYWLKNGSLTLSFVQCYSLAVVWISHLINIS